MRTTRILVALGAFVLLASPPAFAQLVVNDPTTTARNAVTAVLKSQLLQTLRLERDRLRQMSRRLSRYTSLDRYRLEDPPRWRTHGGDFLFSQPYNDALINGAALIGARQKQARLQLVTAIAEQLVVENKRARDAETAGMNMLVGRLRGGRDANASLVAGAAADRRSWRQP